MKHTLLGLDADEWAASDGLPERSPMTGGPVTEQHVTAAIAAMLRRMDDETADATSEPVGEVPMPGVCPTCGYYHLNAGRCTPFVACEP